MSTDAKTASPQAPAEGASPMTNSFFSKLELFGEEIVQIELTHSGTANFEYPLPFSKYSVTEDLGVPITFTFELANNGQNFKVTAVPAS